VAVRGDKQAPATRPKGPEKASGRPQEAKSGANQDPGRGRSGKGGFLVIKTERLPDGRIKSILKDKATGKVVEKID